MTDPAWAIVPVKSLADAKQRLARVLPLRARRRLMLTMLQDVLAVLRQVGRAFATGCPFASTMRAR